MPINECIDTVTDCGKNRMIVNGMCYDFSETSSPVENGITYTLNPNNVYGSTIKTTSKPSAYMCLYDCNKTKDCNLVKYNFDKKECTLLNTDSPNNNTLVSKDDPTDCINVYNRSSSTNEDVNAINVDQRMNNIYISFKDGSPPLTVPKIQGEYKGIECRNDVAVGNYDSSRYNSLLSDMSDYCKTHPHLEVCNKFCKNPYYSKYCPKRRKTLFLIFSSLFFLLLIFSIIFLVMRKKKFFSILGILTLIFLSLSVWKAIPFFTFKNYNGNESDNSPLPMIKKECTDMLFKCTDPSKPLGQRCTRVNKIGNGVVVGKDKCEKGGCCQSGYTDKDGSCRQTLPTGTMSWENTSTGNMIMVCPEGLLRTAKIPPPACNLWVKPREGDVFCSGGANPEWKTCTEKDGCAQNTTYYSTEWIPGQKNPPQKGREVSLKVCTK